MPKDRAGSLAVAVPYLRSLQESLQQGERVAIAGLGDSLTFGWMVERGFFDRLVDRLSAAYPGARLERINAGVPGSTAPEGLARLPGVLGQEPDLLIVQFGLNDCFAGVTREAFQKALRSIAGQAIRAGVRVVLSTSCPVSDPEFMDLVKPYYRDITGLADRLQIPAADLEKHWNSNELSLSAPRSRLYQPDGVHPTDAGHGIMADGLSRLFGL